MTFDRHFLAQDLESVYSFCREQCGVDLQVTEGGKCGVYYTVYNTLYYTLYNEKLVEWEGK
jgi:hypothetical protein